MNVSLLLYIVLAASVVMGAIWYFIIAPMERKNHARKLAILQQKIKTHEDGLSARSSTHGNPGTTDDAVD